ncbi:MAG: SDR family NAD(P)-dependent oxidoreductase [Rhodococcus sp. (in: high G+C Gram-positive bacteria)]
MAINELARLDDRVVIVTGASSGLGVTIATAAAEMGADVVLAARRRDRLAETAKLVEAAGGTALVVETDTANVESSSHLVEQAMDRFGRVDVLVNNAGVSNAVPAVREDPDDFRRIVEVNLYGSYWASQAAARVMKPGSAIVNVSSVLAFTTLGLPQAAYSASKAAVVGLTRDLAQQWGPRLGIRVNAVAPGIFRTEMTEKYPAGYMEKVMGRMLLGREGDPRELAAAVVWLASPAAGYITGQTILVDGGVSIT